MAQHQYSFSLLLTVLLLLLLLFHGRTTQQQQQLGGGEISPVDLAALREIRKSLFSIPPGTDFFATWDVTSPDPCSTFAGVTCSDFLDPPPLSPSTSSNFTIRRRRVTSLTLGTGLSDSEPELAGNLSPTLSNLTELTQLVLFAGVVTGPILPQLGNLKNLRVLSLTNNRLMGPIPDAVPALPNLHTLDLSYNLLSGALPAAGLMTTQLKVLILASNRFSSWLPDPLPGQLLHLDLKNNRFWGPLPYQLPLRLRYPRRRATGCGAHSTAR